MPVTMDRATSESYGARMLEVADRLFDEFGDLGLLTIAEAMNTVRRPAFSDPSARQPQPEAVYRLARSALLDRANAG